MTIKDLAAKTGYAVGTVSRALNNQPNVSPEARKAILEAARECGFQVNPNARRLKQHSSNTVLAVVKGTRNELFGEMAEIIQALMAPTAYQLAVDYVDEDGDEVERALQLSRERKPRGILFLGGNRRSFTPAFAEAGVPSVLLTNSAQGLGLDNLSSVSTDDAMAAEAAIDLLIARGHTRIAIIGGDLTVSDTSRARYSGCLRAFAKHAMDFDLSRNYQSARYSWRDGYAAVNALLARGCRPTAIFAHADVMAVGAIRALWEHGLRVPEDVSVMGVDGLPLGNFLVPQLATVEQDVPRLAERGVALLLAALEEGKPASHETVPFRLLERESVRQYEG